MTVLRFEDLDCWKEARKLGNLTYAAIRGSPGFRRDARLKDQCVGAAVSVSGNIAEGFVRRSNREFTQFLFISISSAAELQSHLYLARDQGYLDTPSFEELYEQAGKTARLISGLITYLLKNQTRRAPQTKQTRSTQ
jgi:four helix bundle protein